MSISASRTIIVGVVGILTACSEPTAPSPVDARAPMQDRAAVYQITVLPTLWGYSEVHAINDAGDAVGFSQVEGFFGHPVLWRDGAVQDLGTLGGSEGRAYDVDARGRVVGWAQTATGESSAFLWSDGVMTQLRSPGVASAANALNPAGVIVGYYTDAQFRQHALRWEGGQFAELPTLGGFESEATGIAPSGDIVGWSQLADGLRHATLWRDGQPVDLGSLGTESFARAISPSGIVVGQSDKASGFTAFAWRKGELADVGPEDAAIGSDAEGVNASGTIVGRSVDADGLNAFVRVHGTVTRLPRLPGSTYTRAFDVNARGDVAGYSLVGDMVGARPVIWTRR